MKSLMLAGTLLFGTALMAYDAQPVAADTSKVQQLIQDKADAFVTLEVVLDIRFAGMGGQNQSEQRREVVVPIIDENGLGVTALSVIDPGSFSSKITGNEDQFVTRIRGAKYILPNGNEINVGVVLRDPEYDLVFIRPTEAPAEKMAFIDMADSATAQILDPVYTISRLGRISRRSILGMSGEIQSVVRGPRTYYIPSSELVSNQPGTGNAIFNADGKFIGLTALYAFPGGQRAIGENDEPYAYVIIPADDIAPVAEQAKTADVEELPAIPDAPSDEDMEDSEDSDETTE